MAEVPHMPTREEILARAIEVFMEANPGAPTPEEDELKEGNYWEQARTDLMSSTRSQLEGYLSFLEGEAAKIREELGIVEVIPEERMVELENKLSTITERYKTTKTRLGEAREELRRIKEELPPPPPPKGLGREQKSKLEDAFRRVFEEARITKIPMATFRDELAALQEDLKGVERARAFELAYERITATARALIPVRPPAPPPVVAPPPPERPPVVVPPVELLGPRRRDIETVTCWVPGCFEPVIVDRDLMRRVTVVPVLKEISPRGPRYEPLLMFPPRFYWMCDTHREENFGYRNIYDVLAFLIFESRSHGKRLMVTKGTLVNIGLDDEDIKNVQIAEAKWMPRSL